MGKGIEIGFNIQSGFSQATYPQNIYTSSSEYGTYTLYASGFTGSSLVISGSTIDSYVGDIIYVKIGCKGCKDQIFPVRLVPTGISVVLYPIASVCPDIPGPGNTGSITVAVCGGAPPYTYSWSGYTETGTVYTSTSKNISSLDKGTYALTVTDCYGLTSTATTFINEPDDMTISAAVVHNSAASGVTANGSVTITVTGGNGGYSYKIGTGSWVGTNVFTGLAPGTYTFYAKDLGNCEISLQVVVKNCYFNVELCGETCNGYGYYGYNGGGYYCYTGTSEFFCF